jgi:hypothetical protein
VEATRGFGRARWRLTGGVAVALAYSWIASGLRPFTHPEELAVAIPIIVAGIGVLRVRGDGGEPAPGGAWIWGALFAVLVAWELISFRLSPRVDHPTLSSIADWAMSTHPGRFGMFAAWLGVGFWLFRR